MSLPVQIHSATSCDAAEWMLPRVGTARRRVYDAIEAAGAEGLTDEQIVDRTKLNPSTARPRRVELVVDGLIVELGTREVRSGLRAAVWVAARFVGQLELAGVR